MRPSSAYGRGTKLQSTTQENFNKKNQKTNPILAGKVILTDGQVEQQLNICRQNEVEVLKAQMNLKLDITQKRQEESKKIIINGYEEQCKLINEINEKKIETLRQEQEKFIEKLLNKQNQEIKDLEKNYESKIKSLKQQLDDAQREIIRKQEEMMDQFSQEKGRIEQKQQKKIEEIKQKQKEKNNHKIEKLKSEWLEDQEDQHLQIKKECQKQVQQELKEMSEQINSQKEKHNELTNKLAEKNKETQDLYLKIRDLKEQNASLSNSLQNINASQQNNQIHAKQKYLQQVDDEIQQIEENNEDNTDYESLDGNNYIQNDVSVPYDQDLNHLNDNENNNNQQELMDFQQLQSDIKQSIQYQIHLLHSKSQNQSSILQNNQKEQIQQNQFSSGRNYPQNILENFSLKIDKNESIKIQSNELYLKQDNLQLLEINNQLEEFENLSLNNSQDYVLDKNCLNSKQHSDSESKKSPSNKAVNTSFKFEEELIQKDKQIIKLKNENEKQKIFIQDKIVEFEKIKEKITIQFNSQLKDIIETIKDKSSRQSKIIQTYQNEIKRLMNKIQNISDNSNTSYLPVQQVPQSLTQVPQTITQVKKQPSQSNLETAYTISSQPLNLNGKQRSDNKSDQKKNEQKQPQFLIQQKSNQKHSIQVRNNQKSINPYDQKINNVQQTNVDRQNKI